MAGENASEALREYKLDRSQDSTVMNRLSLRNGPSLAEVAPNRSVWPGPSSNPCFLTYTRVPSEDRDFPSCSWWPCYDTATKLLSRCLTTLFVVRDPQLVSRVKSPPFIHHPCHVLCVSSTNRVWHHTTYTQEMSEQDSKSFLNILAPRTAGD